MTAATRLMLDSCNATPKPFGVPVELREKGRALGAAATSAYARTAYADIAPTVHQYHDEGVTLRGIAAILNKMGRTTRRGKLFTQVQVLNILNRYPKPVADAPAE